MIDWLILAEKASQARDIANAIFDQGRPKGDLTKGGLGGRNLSSRFPGEVKVARFQGHVVEMAYPDQQNPKYSRTVKEVKWVSLDGLSAKDRMLAEMGFPVAGQKQVGDWQSPEAMLSVYPVELPIDGDRIVFESSGGSQKQQAQSRAIGKNVLNLFKSAKQIVIATDADAEGEMIFRNWAKLFLGDRFNLPEDRLYRVLISSTDPTSVNQAFDQILQRYDQYQGKLGQFYTSLFPQGYARGVADYEFGLSYTLYGELLSGHVGERVQRGVWGRLKNTILGHVAQAEAAHDNFKPGFSYRVDLKLPDGVLLQSDQVFKEKGDARPVIDRLSSVKTVDVQGDVQAIYQAPPLLYSRAELLMAAQGVKSKDWGPALQSAYEQKKVLSYPRTDSRYITSLEWDGLKAMAQNPFIQSLLKKRAGETPTALDRTPDTRWVDPDKTIPHYALIPNPAVSVTEALYHTLTPDEETLYTLDLYRSLALFYADTHLKRTKAQVVQDGITFKGQFDQVVDLGWRKLTGDTVKETKAPQLGYQAAQWVVTPVPAKQPSLLTPAQLLKRLKQRGEGTSATRDQTIEVLLKKKALRRNKGGLRLNSDLKPVVDLMLQHGWIDLDQTAQWQHTLDKITSVPEARQFIQSVRSDTQKLQQSMTDYVEGRQ